MNRIRKTRLVVLLAILLIPGGCHHRSGHRSNCGHIDLNKASDAAAILAATTCQPGIRVDFDISANSNLTGSSNIDSLTSGEPLSIGLNDCCCVAALNSPIANLIDRERKAVCCELGCVACVDRFLSGQALEQRNKAAGNAGELFLRLVEVNLQRQLLEESIAKKGELEQAEKIADVNGLATEQADAELQSQSIALQKKLVEVNQAEAALSVKLNLILGIDSCCPRAIQPCFDLLPEPVELDIDQLVILGLSDRPELSAMCVTGGTGGCSGCAADGDCLALISKIEPRLGSGAASSMRKCLLLQLVGKRSSSSDGIRRQQLDELRAAREELVRQEVIEAVIKIEAGLQRLALENEDLKRLERRNRTIEASTQLDALSAYIDSIENWAEQYQVKAQRISTAIEVEIAKVRLHEATGQWIAQCGLCTSHPCAGSCVCRN